MSDDSLPPVAFAAALAGLDRLTPTRLLGLVRAGPWPEVWRMIAGDIPASTAVGRLWSRTPALRDEWQACARRRPPDQVWAACAASGTDVVVIDSPRYPALLAVDPLPPPVLFARGDLGALDGRRAGIVGTRNATEGGRRLAARLGRELAEAGVRVVSGLARGIDGCAHRGVLSAASSSGTAPGPPIAVVASGPDIPYPREHTGLWNAVIERGLLLSEHPPGSPPLADWFPLRNRIIAALSEVVVVVESRASGGSLITVREATKRQIGVLAVPGSLLNRAAEGTNRLIADGGQAVLDTLDVLVALGLDTRRAGDRVFDARARPDRADQHVLDAFDGDALTIDEVVARADVPLVDLALALGRLEAGGWLRAAGGWFEPMDARSRAQ
ncbi:MAG: DNA-processing protein DprA [Acidimicrobiia bacterium]